MTVRLSMEAEKTELIVPKNPFSFVSTEISFEFGPLQSGKTNGGRMRQILKVLTLVLLYFGEHAFGYGRPKKGEALSVSQKNFNGPFPASFIFSFVFSKQIKYNLMVNNICQWLDSNHGSLVLEATARTNLATTTAQQFGCGFLSTDRGTTLPNYKHLSTLIFDFCCDHLKCFIIEWNLREQLPNLFCKTSHCTDWDIEFHNLLRSGLCTDKHGKL